MRFTAPRSTKQGRLGRPSRGKRTARIAAGRAFYASSFGSKQVSEPVSRRVCAHPPSGDPRRAFRSTGFKHRTGSTKPGRCLLPKGSPSATP